MDRIAQLDRIVAEFDLNLHPFYQDWRMGTLPTETLAHYGAEYGRFVGTIADGWETIGESHYAEEERIHEGLWTQFRAGIPSNSRPALASTETLVTAAKNLFGTRPEAIGALYAFEAQQPHTSQSKLDGLNEHYQVSDASKEYFVVHAGDVQEVATLREYVAKLSDEEFGRAKTACTIVCAAMYGALDGLYYSAQTINA